ncbi:50S ribosomal protein L25/general stress protein Ctc [Larkinella knui]|uniref:Large ribosomal subunit protein bL25 n=1 Tax=Larkinella knui TaxID=2025310 RepID=A0A3P1CX55_9BACT|nr:50S ribosomal protein L25/general stress protein Ctc [Larkinella knui]RRB17768.1 50S ribosomal protein L25/general stress protein Ctc [Larkinella knui]
MKQHEIVGYNRANLGKTESKALRIEGNVPCVLYGGKTQVHFYSPAILFRKLLTTPEAYEVTLNIEGDEYKAILQDAQFHPVNDQILHCDFLEIVDGVDIKVEVPIRFTGVAPGVQKGGKLIQKLRKLKLRGAAERIPDYVDVNIADLDLGKTVKVSAVQLEGVEILDGPMLPIATIEIPRSMRGKAA